MSNTIEMRIIDNSVNVVSPVTATTTIRVVNVGPQGVPGPVGSVPDDVLADISDYHNLPNLTLLFENSII